MVYFKEMENANWLENNLFMFQVSEDELMERVVLKRWDKIQTDDDDTSVWIKEMKPDKMLLVKSFFDGEKIWEEEIDVPTQYQVQYNNIYDRIIAFYNESYNNTFKNGIYIATIRDEKKKYQLRLVFSLDGKSVTVLRVGNDGKAKQVGVLNDEFLPLDNTDVFEIIELYEKAGYKVLDKLQVPKDLMTDYFSYEPFTPEKLINRCRQAVINAEIANLVSDKKIEDFVNGEIYNLFLNKKMLFYISIYPKDEIYLLESEYMELYEKFRDKLKSLYRYK